MKLVTITLSLLLILLAPLASFANSNVVNIYIWSDYIPARVIQQFEHKTGIKVNINEFDSNETMYAKLKASPYSGYDIIFPSSYYVDKMRLQGMLHKLDKSKLPNFKHLNPQLLNKKFDPHNNYSVPYVWGTTGIVINKKYHQVNSIKNWRDLWQSRYKNQLLILDDMREAFAIAFITLGYSINDTNPQHIYQAYLRLKQLMPNIRVINSDAEQNIYIDEDLTLGMGWNGDIHMARHENSNLTYIYPDDGFSIWIDCFAITKHAPHLSNAYKFINFILEPKISAEIVLRRGYSTPNLEAVKLLPARLRHNPIINPSTKTLKRGQIQNDVGNAVSLYAKYWELLKING